MQLGKGTLFASYQIERLLGRGGMGEVYLAAHVVLGRLVALKLLAPELAAHPEFRERFLGESRLAASLEHPNVVTIYEAGESDGRLYIAMRYVDGDDLGIVLKDGGRLAPARAIRLLGGIASALDEAHGRGLVHRDVKPGNILVQQPGTDAEHAYLADFGLVKAIDAEIRLTRTGQYVGSAEHVAPEQIEGAEVDGRADIYALAAVLYHVLAGQPPFPRLTEMATMWAHVQAPPPALSDLHPELAPFDAAIQRGMAKAPADRHPSAEALLRDLAAGLEPGAPPDTPRPEREAPALPSRVGSSSVVPPPGAELDPLIGRDQAMRSLLAELDRSRLVTLTGPGGSGKTRLAEAAVRTYRARGLDAWLVDLSAVRDPALVPVTIQAALGLEGAAGQSPVEVLAGALGDRDSLLALDNLEQIASAGQMAADLLARLPATKILATSRVPLGTRGETEMAVPPLDLPVSDDVADLEASPAGALFLARARALGRLRNLDVASAGACAALVRRLDGLPLALELAAARTRALTPVEILRRLDAGGLAAIHTDESDGHRSLLAILDWTLGLLPAGDRQVLDGLAVCAGFDLNLAQALAPDADAVRAMESLVALGLVVPVAPIAQTSRFRLLETIRSTVAAKLDPAAHATLRGRHAEHMRTLAHAWFQGAEAGQEANLLPRHDADGDNIRLAIDWLASADPTAAIAMWVDLHDFWATRGRLVEAVRRFDELEPLVPGDGVDLARASAFVAGMASELAPTAEVRRRLDSAWDRARATRDPMALLLAAAARVLRATSYGDLESGSEELAVLDAIDPAVLGRRSQLKLAEARVVAVASVEGPSSDAHLEALLRLRSMLREPQHAGIANGNLAHVRLARGEFGEAASAAAEAVEQFRALERPNDLAWALGSLTIALAEQRRVDEAIGAAIEGARLASEIGHREAVVDAVFASVPVALAIGRPVLAVRLLSAVLRAHERGEYTLGKGDRLRAEVWRARAATGSDPEALEVAGRESSNADLSELLRSLPAALQSPGEP